MITPGSDQYLEFDELKHIIGLSIESLPLKCRKIYQLSRDGEMTNSKIAAELGISVKTVENQITIPMR